MNILTPEEIDRRIKFYYPVYRTAVERSRETEANTLRETLTSLGIKYIQLTGKPYILEDRR